MRRLTLGIIVLALAAANSGCGSSKPDDLGNYRREFGPTEQMRKDHVSVPPSAESGGDANARPSKEE